MEFSNITDGQFYRLQTLQMSYVNYYSIKFHVE